jgi:hypothetical protein
VLLPAGQRASGEWIDDTLRTRVEENGLLARTPLAGEFPRQRIEVVHAADPTAEVNRLYRHILLGVGEEVSRPQRLKRGIRASTARSSP